MSLLGFNSAAGTLLAVAAALFHITGLLTAAHAVWNCRTSQGAIAWGFSLTLFPYLTVPAYWILGKSKFQGYQRAFREGTPDRSRLIEQLQALRDWRAQSPAEYSGLYQGIQGLSRFPITSGNRVQLLVDGEATFEVMFADIESATHYVYLEFFLIADDAIGRELKKLLVRKAGEGVKIYFIYDELGSIGLPRAYVSELRDAGIQIFPFYPARALAPGLVGLKGISSFFAGRLQFNFRNHRKITVVDGKVAHVGGINVHDASLGRSKFYGPWRDTHLRIEGPAVAGIQLVFLDDYFWATKGQMPEHLEFLFPPAESPGEDGIYLAPGPADSAAQGTLFFLHCIQSAQRRIWLTTPYFVPTPSVMDALKAAKLRGVDVKIIIPLRWDLLIMYLAAYSYLPEAEAAGLEVYRYGAGHPHQKVMLVDDNFSWVGSSNLDARSMQLNFEGNFVVFGEKFASGVETMLLHDLERSLRVGARDYQERSLIFKLGVKVSRLFESIL